MRLAAIDPQKDYCAVAWFEDGRLLGARIVDVEALAVSAPYYLCVDVVVLEKPQSYSPSRQKGDQNDLISIAVTGGRVAQWLRPADGVVLVTPAAWKGQVPKDVTKQRAEEELSSAELALLGVDLRRIETKRKKGDVWDAVGIGLHWLRRTR